MFLFFCRDSQHHIFIVIRWRRHSTIAASVPSYIAVHRRTILIPTPVILHLRIEFLRRFLRTSTHHRSAITVGLEAIPPASTSTNTPPALYQPRARATSWLSWRTSASNGRPRTATGNITIDVLRRWPVLPRAVTPVPPPSSILSTVLSPARLYPLK